MEQLQNLSSLQSASSLRQSDGAVVTQLSPLMLCSQENPDPLATPPPSGQKVSYQTDPRPHFGVAWSSHSTCRPLWGSEGPCWGQRQEDVPDQTHSCPHCHLELPLNTLRWHEVSRGSVNTWKYFPTNTPLPVESLTVCSPPLHRQSVYCSKAGTPKNNNRQVLFVLLKCLPSELKLSANKLFSKDTRNICSYTF